MKIYFVLVKYIYSFGPTLTIYAMIPDFKVCKICKIEKPSSEFFIDKKIYLASYCKECDLLRVKKYREANREKAKAYQKKYREENREKINAIHKKYREANRKKINAQKKKYREANPQKAKAYQKKHYEANREKINARNKKYQEANREKINAINKRYREANREKVNALHKRSREDTRDSYVRSLLKQQGFTNEQIDQHSELLEIKRLTIKINRL